MKRLRSHDRATPRRFQYLLPVAAVIFFVGVTVSVCETAEPPTLVNGSMSQGGDVPTGCETTYVEKGKLQVVRDTQDYVKGPASLRLDSVGGPADGNCSQTIQDAAGKTFTVRGYAKSAGVDYATVAVLVQDRNWKIDKWQDLFRFARARDWTPFEGEVFMPTNINVKGDSYGAKGDGETDERTAIQAAINAVQNAGGGTVYFPYGVYLVNAGNLSVNNNNVFLVGDNATLKTTAGKYISLYSCGVVTGFRFESVYIRIPYNADFSQRGCWITENYFDSGGSFGVYVEHGYDQNPSRIFIERNFFKNRAYVLFGQGFTYSSFSNNLIENGGKRNVEVMGGYYSKYCNNIINGGITGISFLANRSVNRIQGFHDNVISGNIIRGISEEPISFDLRGNNPGRCGSIVQGTVSSHSVPGRYIVPSFTMASYGYISNFVCFLDGKLAGRIYKNIDMGAGGNSYIQLDTDCDASLITDGDAFVVVVPAYRNIISENVIASPATGGSGSGIILWGNSFENIISDNSLNDSAINLVSLTGIVDGVYGPVNNNLIECNKVFSSSLAVQYQDLGGGVYTTYPSYGNRCINNDIIKGNLIYKYQKGRLINNNRITEGTLDTAGTESNY